jgi:hypothetical protein
MDEIQGNRNVFEQDAREAKTAQVGSACAYVVTFHMCSLHSAHAHLTVDTQLYATSHTQQGDAARKLKNTTIDVKRAGDHMQHLKRSKGDRYSRFDNRNTHTAMAKVVAAVAAATKAKKFKAPVRGPIGAFVSVKAGEERWKRAIDSMLEKSLVRSAAND